MGEAARKFVEQNAGLDAFVTKIVASIKAGHEAHFGK
jgi:hypothetical protein